MRTTAPVSVIIPVRNGAAHLRRAIASVLDQKLRPMEVLVMDGGSTDDSAAIASAHAGVRLIRQQSLGLSGARNEAIRQSRSPFVAFCDADDQWADGALESRLTAIESDPAALAVIGHVLIERLGDAPPTHAQESRIGSRLPGFTPGAMLARREAFDVVGWFDEALQIGADSDWFIRLQQSARPARLIDAVVLHKGARGSSLSTNVVQYRRELLIVARRFIDAKRKAGAG